MNCPKCREKFSVVDVGEFSIDKCDNCNTIWFDIEEFENYYDTTFTIKEKFIMKQPTEVACPRCSGHFLTDGNVLKLKISLCKKCKGVLVYESEIKKLMNTDQSIWDYLCQIDPFLSLENILSIFE